MSAIHVWPQFVRGSSVHACGAEEGTGDSAEKAALQFSVRAVTSVVSLIPRLVLTQVLCEVFVVTVIF